MTTRQREKRLQHLRRLGPITLGMEWCLRTDRGMDWQYCADQIGLPLNPGPESRRGGGIGGCQDERYPAAGHHSSP
jgi:hypothetical protein